MNSRKSVTIHVSTPKAALHSKTSNNPNSRLQQALSIFFSLSYCRQDLPSTILCNLDSQRCTHAKLYSSLQSFLCIRRAYQKNQESSVHCCCSAALDCGSLLRSEGSCSLLCKTRVSWDYHHANEISDCDSHMLKLNKQTEVEHSYSYTVS